MYMFLNSEAVGVFPTTGRPQKDPLGRLTTEYNLTSLINTLLDVDGFVITHQALDENKKIIPFKADGNNINTDIPFQFNIKGYIFTIHNLKDFLNDSNISSLNPDSENPVIPIYASIELKLDAGSATTSTGDENLNRIQSIVGIDDDKGKYKGLRFDNVADKGRIYLKILEKRLDGWYIPEESKIKLKTSKAGDNKSVSIDDGVIE